MILSGFKICSFNYKNETYVNLCKNYYHMLSRDRGCRPLLLYIALVDELFYISLYPIYIFEHTKYHGKNGMHENEKSAHAVSFILKIYALRLKKYIMVY